MFLNLNCKYCGSEGTCCICWFVDYIDHYKGIDSAGTTVGGCMKADIYVGRSNAAILLHTLSAAFTLGIYGGGWFGTYVLIPRCTSLLHKSVNLQCDRECFGVNFGYAYKCKGY
eukprot:6080191-Amphidinium_carterae.1